LKRAVFVGDVFKTNCQGNVEVIAYNNANDITVRFQSGYERSATSGNLRRGKVKDPTTERTEPSKRTSREEFLSEAFSAHADLYDYSKMVYLKADSKVEIICRKEGHGSFWQIPEKHKKGQGCPKCSGHAGYTAERFSIAATTEHDGAYSYRLVADVHFLEESKKVPIICKVHGVFWQQYNNHLNGQGCRKCAKFGFNVGKQGTLYVLQDAKNVKVGITNREVDTRVKEINKPSGNFSIVKAYPYKSGLECADHETLLLRYLRDNYKNLEGTFSGVSESFEDVDVSLVLEKIENLRRIGE
jgi:hypothetical protein